MGEGAQRGVIRSAISAPAVHLERVVTHAVLERMSVVLSVDGPDWLAKELMLPTMGAYCDLRHYIAETC